MSKREDFAEFYDASWNRTVACAYAISGDLGNAEEISQEAYCRAWARWSRLSAYDNPAAWVRQTATNLAISRWRRSKVAWRFLERSRPPEHIPPPDPSSLALVEALRTLPTAQLRAIVLHHLADLPVNEVARIEGCPSGTIKARLSRGRNALAAQLRPSPESRATPPNSSAPNSATKGASHVPSH